MRKPYTHATLVAALMLTAGCSIGEFTFNGSADAGPDSHMSMTDGGGHDGDVTTDGGMDGSISNDGSVSEDGSMDDGATADGSTCPTTCDDGDACNGVETCNPSTLTCDPGTPLVVDDADFCNGTETCVPGSGGGDYTVTHSGDPCSDGIACTQDTCIALSAQCVFTPTDSLCADSEICRVTPMVCDDSRRCASGTECRDSETCGPAGTCCEPATGGCTHVACTTDDGCNDGLACNGTETCDVSAHACRSGTALSCDDGVACSADVCRDNADHTATCVSTAPDLDSDGYGDAACVPGMGQGHAGDDCNDSAAGASIHPGATELCNSVDDNCAGGVDEGYSLGAACATGVGACVASGSYVCATGGLSTTCNAVAGSPTMETCNGIDDDCDSMVDDNAGITYYRDSDMDGYGSTSVTTMSCTAMAPAGYTSDHTDCNDSSSAAHPGLVEVCGDSLDNDCLMGADDACAPPANDQCGSATIIGSLVPNMNMVTGPQPFDNATAQLSSTDCAGTTQLGGDIWYQFSLAGPMVVYIDTLSSSMFDTVLALRNSCGSGAGICNNDSCGVSGSQIFAKLDAGTYYFTVSSVNATVPRGATVTIRLQTMRAGSGMNTRVASTNMAPYYSTPIGWGPMTIPVSSVSAYEPVPSSCSPTMGKSENLHYFALCPGITRTLSASTCGAASMPAMDTVLYVVQPGTTGMLNTLTCNDNGTGATCGTYSATGAVTVAGPGLFGIVIENNNASTGTYNLNVN